MSSSEDPLMQAIEKLGEGSSFLNMVFLFTITPTIFNGMHSMAYVFTAQVPSHWCTIPALAKAQWTDDQIRNISSATSCSYYDFNYDNFAEIGFENALIEKTSRPLPKEIVCYKRTYADDIHGTSIVQDWDLVCEKTAARSHTHMALSLGKLVGSGISGIFSDKYGRKLSYSIGLIMLMVSGPAGAVFPWYWAFMATRFFLGIAHAWIQYPAFTILSEIAGPKPRQWMGVAYNTGFAFGIALVAGVAYVFPDWKECILAQSLPAIILIIHVLCMPESPRWLVSQNRRRQAKELLEKQKGIVFTGDPVNWRPAEPLTAAAKVRIQPPVRIPGAMARGRIRRGARRRGASQVRLGRLQRVESETVEPETVEPVTQQPETQPAEEKDLAGGFSLLLTHPELRIRTIITVIAWLTASLSYYALALNVGNISADIYIYTAIMGLSEIFAYIVPTPILMVMGRRLATGSLYTLAGVCLLLILMIPAKYDFITVGISLFGRFTISVVYSIIILYSSELIPTVSRNSAIGANSTMSHVGSVAAPYVADLLGAVVWWGPTTLCGAMSVLTGVLCATLPETGDRPLANTIEEEMAKGRAVVSWRNVFKFT